MNVHRLCPAYYANAALTGEGARLSGGRWNAKGTPMVYTAATLSLAALEVLVHVDIEDAPNNFTHLAIGIPDRLVSALDDDAQLPHDWRDNEAACRAFGEAWVASGDSLALRVPSAVVPSEHNILINPQHPSIGRAVVESEAPFRFDARLFD